MRSRVTAGNLPAEPTGFIGRRRELVEVRQKLATARLVSLVGPGGVGKTRLAIRSAAQLGRGFRAGAWLVELSEVRDSGLVAGAFASALDLREQAATDTAAHLVAYLKDKELLLVVDNCEHILEVTARLVGTILKTAPGVRVIATSREPLAVPGEHVTPVPPFALPADEPPAQLRQNEAVRLFVDRAATAAGGFELTTANQATVVELCRRLDGLPLAIELAAVRTRVLGIDQILERLADRFSLLTGGGRAALPRHQTLRTTIDWSHDLLSAPERSLLRRLYVFAGGFTLDDVEAVGAGPALDVLASLVDKSLVIKEDSAGSACYRLHETMREYAGARLKEAGEVEAVEELYVGYYLARCVSSAAGARAHLVDWLAWVDLEIDNIRSVIRRCIEKDDARRARDLVCSMHWFWVTRAAAEGVRWLDELLRLAPDSGALALFMRGFLAILQVEPVDAAAPLDRAIALARAGGHRSLLSQALSTRAIAADMCGDRASARRLLDEAGPLTVGERVATLTYQQARALHAFFRGDLATVRLASIDGAKLSRESGDLYSLAAMEINLGYAALIDGDLGDARARLEEALKVARRIDDRVMQLYAFGGLSCHAAASGQPRLSASLLGTAEAIRAQVGVKVMSYLVPVLAQAREVATASLGPTKFEAELKAGAGRSRDAAARMALGESEGKPPRPDADLLATRETDVARLIADGLSNKQIGARLFISERTVDSHVRSILNKLGVNSRAQIAAWVASGDL